MTRGACYKCDKSDKSNSGWIGCDMCADGENVVWAHAACVSLKGVPDNKLKVINWVCDTCMSHKGCCRTANENLRSEMEAKFSVIDERIKVMHDLLSKVEVDVATSTECVTNELSQLKVTCETFVDEVADPCADAELHSP